ncbi:MAG: hypothetical protein GF329_10935 [Candidatus Lokiarchaeota archaeon]|nr:hypothetical protein [Candidatus Lokiarchaeota archaeon]
MSGWQPLLTIDPGYPGGCGYFQRHSYSDTYKVILDSFPPHIGSHEVKFHLASDLRDLESPVNHFS